MAFILWVIAVVLVIIGILKLLGGALLLGALLIVLGLAIGPGGWSFYNGRSRTGPPY